MMSEGPPRPPKTSLTLKNDLGSTFHYHSTMYIVAICGGYRSFRPLLQAYRGE
jgi:hypothetical protein